MAKNNKELLEEFQSDMIKLNDQRRRWLTFSSAIFVGLILIITFTESINNLHSQSLWWAIGSIGIIVSVCWWYWTLTLIQRVLHHQFSVIQLLSEITSDVKDIRTDIKDLHQKGLIN